MLNHRVITKQRGIYKLVILLLLLPLLLSSAAQSRFWLYGGGSYTPNEAITLEYYLPVGQTVGFQLYRVDNPEKVLELGGPRGFSGSEELDLSPLRRFELRQQENYYGQLNLGRLSRGLYFAQLGSGPNATATLILVTDLSLVVKSDQDSILSYTAMSDSGEPRRAKIYLLRGDTLYAEGLAGEGGLTEFNTENNRADLVVAAKYGDSWAFSGSYWRRWSLEKARVYVFSDRPVYRPGQIVYFKGTARSPAGLTPLSDHSVELSIIAADNSEIFRQSYNTDAYGSFSGELSLGLEPPLGSYRIETRVLGQSSYSSFEVQEYQKPEYRVTVTPDSAVSVQGETARFTIKADYLFGGAVAGGKVNYVLFKQPFYRYRYSSRFAFYEETSYISPYGGEIVQRGEGVLNDEGELVLAYALPQDEQAYQLTLQAGVTDEARREISGNGKLVAYRSSLTLNISVDRYAYRTGEELRVTVQAEDLEGKPVSVPLTVSAERYSWQRSEGRQVETLRDWSLQTNEDGTASFSTSLSEQGSYGFIVSAQDGKGRKTSARDSVWVTDGSRWYWAYDGLNITADKPEYELGDTARFVIQSPVADAYALITREGQELYSYEVIKLNGSVLTYELPITEAMTPNGYLSVVIVGNGNTYSETVGFRVPPADKFLNVEINSDSDSYQPGESGNFALRISDASGQGVRAQVALGLVDEAIYLLRPDNSPDIRGFFYALKGNLVGTQLSNWYYFGRAEPLALESAPIAEREAMSDAVFGQGKADFAEPDIREDFRDTILWLPMLETDEDGLATVSVTFPDNLTEWRLTAKAITLDDKVGQNNYQVKTTLPVIARLAAPRFFIRGDDASLRVIGQNNLSNVQTGELRLEADGLVLANPAPQAVSLAAGGSASANFAVQATQSGTATLTASALTPAASDALRLPIPILPHGIREEIGWAGSGSSNWRFSLPNSVSLENTQGTLYLTPSLAAAVSPALSYLAGYPYGCTEQTMSRFLPSVLAAQAGELAQLPEEIANKLDDIVQAGLKRIYDFQHEDGGWGFWQYDASSPFISAYVLSGLLQAQEAGYRVRDSVLERGLNYLEELIKTTSFADYRVVDADGKAYAYYALARAGRNIDGLAGLAGAKEMSAYGLALSVLAFEQAGRRIEAELYLDELLSQVSERERVAYWETNAPRYYWNDDRIEATAYALEALVRLRPDDAIISKVVNWLLLERQGARWVATKDTAAVIRAALTLAEVRNEADIDYQISASLNGAVLDSRRIKGQSTASFELPLVGFRAGANELELFIEGSGTLYASAAVSFFSERDYLNPETEFMTVTRTYEALSPQFMEPEQRYIYQRSPLSGQSTVGDYVLVTVTIEPQGRYRYVLVNEPLPAGYRVVENDLAFRISGLNPRYGYGYYGWNYWYDGRDIRDERVDYYFSSLGDPVTFSYILRAETPGNFNALPTQAWLMYEPEVRGVGVQATLTVTE